MRIAVCFYGQIRTAKFAHPNLLRFFGDLLKDIDFFTHTWDIGMDRPLNMLRTTFNEPYKVSETLIEEYQSLYPHKDFLVEDQIKLRESLQKLYGRPNIKTVSEMTYPYHSFYRAVQFKKQYEQMHRFKYDVVIKLRPDILFPPDRSLSRDIEEFLENPSKIYTCFHDDVYHIGTSENMDKASDFYINTDVLYKSSGLPFDHFKDYINQLGIDLVKMGDSRFTVLRSELTHLDVIDKYHEICYLNSLLYSEIFYHLKYSWKWWYNSRNNNWKEDMYFVFARMLHPDDLETVIKNHIIDL